MKAVKRIWVSAFALAATCTLAQTPESLDGEWRARITLKSGRQVDGKLQIEAAGGTWRTLLQSTGDPCVGIPTPVTWRRLDSGAYELHFHGSKALTGCRDNRIAFERVDARTLKGHNDAGAEIVLTRGG